MQARPVLRSALIMLVLLLNIGCDQISKRIVRESMEFHQQFKFFNNRVMLTRVENKGAFLSMGDTLPEDLRFLVLIVIPFIVLLVGVYYLFSQSVLSKTHQLALTFIVGGGFGNVFDRYYYGAVTDFMHVDFIVFRTGIFNIADVSIMTGAAIAIFSYLNMKNRLNVNFNDQNVI
jgi:signal peptidase II